MSEIICDVCFHHCRLAEGKKGFCKARKNEDGRNVPVNYGELTSLAMDPIEKKPLYGFFPGSRILSAGSFGCNLACPFCQNHEISMHDDLRTYRLSPEELCNLALEQKNNLGVAFTYNEPLISWEFVLDTAKLLRENSLKTVLVTNGCVSLSVLEKLVPYIDAMNIDLKGDEQFYHELSGDYRTVCDTIKYCIPRTHTEITTLIVPGKNDSEELMRRHSRWLSELDPDTYLHITRYFPRYRYTIPATDTGLMRRLKDIAEESLHNVFLGNVW